MQSNILKRAEKSGRKYLAPVPTVVGGLGMIFRVLPLYLRNREERVPATPVGPFHTDPAAYAQPPASGLRVTWFGHSSLLIEQDGVTVLIDPVWDERAAPVQFAGPKRFFPPTLPLADLPHLDAVLLSHDHYDHLGAGTVRQLAARRPGLRWITSLEVGNFLQTLGVPAGSITELDWTQSTVLTSPSGADLTITSVPARHFSGRSLLNRNQTLWASFVLRGAKHNLFYGADSGLFPGIDQIGRQYGPFDLTLLEIGAFNELWNHIHMGPDGAAQAFQQLGGGTLMPIHWGLFDLALHAWRHPIQRLTQVAAEQGIRLFSPTPGTPTEPPAHAPLLSSWWVKQG